MNEKDEKIFESYVKKQFEEVKQAQEWMKHQLEEIDPDKSGVLIFSYGTENYSVSGNAAKKVFTGFKDHFRKRFPKLLVLMVPFWIKAQTIKDMEEFIDADPKEYRQED